MAVSARRTGRGVAVLSKALSADPVVARETEYEGEMPIITLPGNGTEGQPLFILYEKDGQPSCG